MLVTKSLPAGETKMFSECPLLPNRHRPQTGATPSHQVCYNYVIHTAYTPLRLSLSLSHTRSGFLGEFFAKHADYFEQRATSERFHASSQEISEESNSGSPYWPNNIALSSGATVSNDRGDLSRAPSSHCRRKKK